MLVWLITEKKHFVHFVNQKLTTETYTPMHIVAFTVSALIVSWTSHVVFGLIPFTGSCDDNC